MGVYIYGIAISVVMIVAGFSGHFSGDSAGINIPLVIVGALFLLIDVLLLVRTRSGGKK